MALRLLLTLAILFVETAVWAGDPAEREVPRFTAEQIAQFTNQVETALLERDAHVAILARVGRPQDELPAGIHYTHTAFALRLPITGNTDNRAQKYRMYNLYQRDAQPERSDLVQDTPGEFFADVHALEAGVLIPSPELQQQLLKVIRSERYTTLHNANYSVIANPFTLEYQNCTEHLLDVLSVALYETGELALLKAKQQQQFEPQPIEVSRIELWLGALFEADVAISDHPDSPVTATFTTIAGFLSQQDAGSTQFTIQAD